nr:class I SAM-dependent methyltransferase [bacterium]
DQFGAGTGTRVLDLGCGPGLYTTPLARAGADVTGVDFSESSLEHVRAAARRESLSIDYVHANYLEYEPAGKFDLITLIYWDLCPLSPAQRHTVLEMCHRCLSDKGIILLDVPSMKYFESVKEGVSIERAPDGGFWSADPYFVLKTTFKYDADRVTLDRYTLVESGGTREIYNWLQSYDRKSLEREFATCGLEVIEVLGDVAGAPYDPESTQMAIVARRRA